MEFGSESVLVLVVFRSQTQKLENGSQHFFSLSYSIEQKGYLVPKLFACQFALFHLQLSQKESG